jgi:FkbM family methyltransferase
MRTNGERSLQKWAMSLAPPGEIVNVVDVGANKGQWSIAMLTTAERAGRIADLRLHAFEPSLYTFGLLSEVLSNRRAYLYREALSDVPGSAILHVVAPAAGTNSLYCVPDLPIEAATEEVTTTTLDSFARRAGMGRLTLVKIDAEGHDIVVLRGARRLFAEQRISVVQFEYNHRWIHGRFFLRDAFEMLEPLGYRIGKLTPRGVEFYPGWDPELETFIENNYVACLEAIAEKLPSVSWWKVPPARKRFR